MKNFKLFLLIIGINIVTYPSDALAQLTAEQEMKVWTKLHSVSDFENDNDTAYAACKLLNLNLENHPTEATIQQAYENAELVDEKYAESVPGISEAISKSLSFIDANFLTVLLFPLDTPDNLQKIINEVKEEAPAI